jgi:hypothetical protein
MSPSETLATKNLPGKKKHKTRITIGLFCNMDGSSKEFPVIINNAKNPRCFKGYEVSKLPIHYYSNKKAWMTSNIFVDWLNPFVCRLINLILYTIQSQVNKTKTLQITGFSEGTPSYLVHTFLKIASFMYENK